MIFRKSVEDREQKNLAPYAVFSSKSRGRKHSEKEHQLRTAFQRDRDRIVYSTSFRRLEYKTQVFVNHEGDHYRTRLTHTIEMTLIARTIGRALLLNEDLIEAIALAHDLGHGPFGHAGERVLSVLMKKHGGFEHNQQCTRLVEQLEESYAGFPGLNLTFEVREGLKKHERNIVRSLEADVVDHADSIAYNCHDLDDGLRAGLLDVKMVRKVALWDEVAQYVDRIDRSLKGNIKIKIGVRLLVNRLVSDLIDRTATNLEKAKLKSTKDYIKHGRQIISFSPEMRKKVQELTRFLHKNLYQHFRVVRMTEKGQRFIQRLFAVYIEKPAQLPPQVLARTKQFGLHRAVCDYISGMTDRYALDEYQRFFAPYERV
jgi:dGTPase